MLAMSASAAAQQITAPKQHFGFNIGDDYHLANYKQLTDYWRKLDAESDRMVLHEMGKTAEGLVTVGAPALARLGLRVRPQRAALKEARSPFLGWLVNTASTSSCSPSTARRGRRKARRRV